MDKEEHIHKLVCYTAVNKQTGRIIEVTLWDEVYSSGFQVVTIATDEAQIILDTHDLPGLLSSLKSISDIAVY